ncbi:MAG: FAD-dependent oxidoreductase [Gammaproteobacteria bacterium]|nr:FAD-dependent oxidoreductase [Gammaproteobacteria bacterium]MBT4494518.1 FAD-dependent oxidoreductase [Gammaproteobacteria bacterium]
MSRDYDVIIVGSGAAGLSAAVAAADTGASVLVIEADTRVGGSSRLSGGHFYAAGTSLQAEAGVIGDSADAMFEHYMTLNQWMVDPSVVRQFCDLSAPTFEWLKDLGVGFPKAGVYPSGVSSTPRGHQPEGSGEEVINVLDGHRSHKGVDLVLDSRVTDLIMEDGRITGIKVGNDEARCAAVIMATGGFGANPEMIKKYYPQAAASGDWNWYIGTEGAQGDGITLGTSVGASIDGYDRGLLLVTPGFSHDLEVLLPGWLILVNRQGRRFTSESAPYTVLGGLIQREGGSAFAVFDEEARLGAKPSPISQANWVADVLERKAKEGSIFRADSLEDLARSMDVSTTGLIGTIERYNADVSTGTDSAFFKNTGMKTITEPPFYGVEIRPAIICWTGTGLRIDAETRVMGHDEKPIPGLFAAGETIGNLHGDRYVGGGGSFGPCIVFGKLAGENASRYTAALNES